MTNNTSPAAAAKSAIHIMLQGKGGVGKSLISAILAQYFASVGDKVYAIDTDPINQTLKSYAGLNANHIELMNGSKIDERKFDALMERMMTQEGTYIVDNGASSFVPFTSYLLENNAIEMLQEAGRNVFIHTVVTGGQALKDTVAGFKSLAAQTPIENIIVWLNEYFGEIQHSEKNFRDMAAYVENKEKVQGIIRIAARNPDTFGKDIQMMTGRKMLFSEAIAQNSNFTFMEKRRLTTIRDDIFQQLNNVNF